MSKGEYEQAQDQIKKLKDQLLEIQNESKETERALLQDQKVLQQEKDQLLTGIQARMQLIDILKRDIAKMAYVESTRIAETEYNKLPPLQK